MTKPASGSAHHQPAECVQEQPDEHGGGEVAVDHRHPRLGLEDAVAELPTGTAFPPASANIASTVAASQPIPSSE